MVILVALLQCPDCGNGVSEHAQFCPRCGCPATHFPKTGALKVGDTLLFGRFNGECIKWRVLDIWHNSALIHTCDYICQRPYHGSRGDITWEDCDLRYWLNREFLRVAFTDGERSRIERVLIGCHDNPKFKTKGGADTTDSVFLLSMNEALKYFKSNEDRACDDDWWLRTPGNHQDCAASVMRKDANFNTHFHYGNSNVDLAGFDARSSIGVRPALLISQ